MSLPELKHVTLHPLAGERDNPSDRWFLTFTYSTPKHWLEKGLQPDSYEERLCNGLTRRLQTHRLYGLLFISLANTPQSIEITLAGKEAHVSIAILRKLSQLLDESVFTPFIINASPLGRDALRVVS